MPRPDLNRVPSFYHGYINGVKESELNAAFEKNLSEIPSFLQNIPEEKWNYRYAEGKWSIKEMVQHIIDAERIFSFRALCFARGEEASLPGFDENTYAANSKADDRSKADLLEELKAVQHSTCLLFKSFDDDQLNSAGIANQNSIYVNAIGFIINGHALHHKKVLEGRYL